MKILKYGTIVKYKSKTHGIIETQIIDIDKLLDGSYVYYACSSDIINKNNIQESFNQFMQNQEYLCRLEDIVSEIKDSDWIDESEI